MYFRNRADAGRLIAKQLEKYKSKNIVIISLGTGAGVVAAQVAIQLHASMLLYVVKNIYLPGETADAVAGLGSGDIFSYNTGNYSEGQIEEYSTEYHSYIEQERMLKSHELHRLVGNDGEINKNMLRHRTVIMVSDGLKEGFTVEVAADFIRTVPIEKLVIATPIASVNAVDRMHLLGDEIVCLSVAGYYMDTDHYYDENIVPSTEGVLTMMRNISYSWGSN